MVSTVDDDKPSAKPGLLHIMSSNSTSAGSTEGLKSWFHRHGGKHSLGSQDITMRERTVDGEFQEGDGVEAEGVQYRTYKRRWFGLVQLTLMNVMVSWDVSLLPPPPRADEDADRTVAHLCARRLQSQ